MRRAGNAHTMGNILLGLRACQLMNMKAHRNTLFELTHLERREFRMQLRLPHENNLQQLATLRFQIGQHTELFQHGRLQVLRLINNHHGIMAGGEFAEEVFIQDVDIALAGRLAWRADQNRR